MQTALRRWRGVGQIARPTAFTCCDRLGGIITEDSLLTAAVLCAMRQRYSYRGYESAEKAMAALRRRCRGIARPELEAAFTLGSALYARAEEVAERLGHEGAVGTRDLLVDLRGEFPEAGAAVICEALTWAYYWRVLR